MYIFIGLYNETDLIYPEFKKNFESLVSEILFYKYTANMSDLPLISKKIFDHYYPNGDIDDPHKTINVSIFRFGLFFFTQLYKKKYCIY